MSSRTAKKPVVAGNAARPGPALMRALPAVDGHELLRLAQRQAPEVAAGEWMERADEPNALRPAGAELIQTNCLTLAARVGDRDAPGLAGPAWHAVESGR